MNRVQLIGDIVWPVEVWTDGATGRTFGKTMLAVSADTDPLVFVPLILQDREAMDAGMYLGEGSRVKVNARLAKYDPTAPQKIAIASATMTGRPTL